MRISVPGSGGPTVWMLASPGCSRVAPPEVSVSPYAWRMLNPMRYKSRPIAGSNRDAAGDEEPHLPPEHPVHAREE